MATLAQAGNVMITVKLTTTAAAALARKRFINAAGTNYPAAGGNYIGISLFPIASGDTNFEVAISGLVVVAASGAISLGDWISSDSSGQAATAAALSIATGATSVTSAAANGASDIAGGVPPVTAAVQAKTAATSLGDDLLVYM